MRPAQVFVTAMAKYASEITINFGGKDISGKSIMNIGVSDLAFIPKTKEDYEAKYNSLLDSLSSYDQSSLEYEKEELELY